MSIYRPTRRLLRCFSTSPFLNFPRASPRTSRPPLSFAKLASPHEIEAIEPEQPSLEPEIPPPKKTRASKKEREEEQEGGEYRTWRPPNFSGKPLPSRQTPSSPSPVNKAQTGPQRDHPSARTQKTSPPKKGADAPPAHPRPSSSSKERFAVPLHQDRVSLRWETLPPTAEQLKTTDRCFLQYPPKFLWSADKFKEMDYGSVPEVAFLGRSNVGKSSLLNALLNNSTMARTSSKPGHTRLMNAFSIAQGKLVLFDMPGYGHASRPEWGVQIMKYLLSRKQFRRAFVLIDALHGPKPSDLLLLDYLGTAGVPYQIVLSKIDRLKRDELDAAFLNIKTLLTDKKKRLGTSALGEILGTAGDPAKKGVRRMGMAELRWAVMVACGMDGSISLR